MLKQSYVPNVFVCEEWGVATKDVTDKAGRMRAGSTHALSAVLAKTLFLMRKWCSALAYECLFLFLHV